MKHVVLALAIILGFALPGGCQQHAHATGTEKASMPVERIEGLWPVLGYLGSKLTNELGERMNIKKKDDDQGVPTRVELRFAWFEVARQDRRKVSTGN